MRIRGMKTHMNEVCNTTHVMVDKRLDGLETVTKNHDDRLDELEKYKSKSEVQITNLCDQIKSLVSTIKWSMALLVTSILGFVIWLVQLILERGSL